MENENDANWFVINNIDTIDSPALVVYPDRVKYNIDVLLSMVDDVNRMRPHVKTHKSREPIELLMQAGIKKFKCATIAEAEMLASAGVPDILLAYQPSLPKIIRLVSLIKKYPSSVFSCLVDNKASAKTISEAVAKEGLELSIYIDLNVGMNRTGIVPGNDVIELYKYCSELKNIVPVGLHAYDGHIRAKDFQERTMECDAAFAPVEQLQQQLVAAGFDEPVIIAGGSPTFPIHAKRKNIECSPGTFIFWDYGYQTNCPEQHFEVAALVISRIISKPAKGKICLDLGHKSIAAENELQKRVYFLNAPALKFTGQSEEHLIFETDSDSDYEVGDVFYGIPYHICPTVALYERAITVENREAKGEWKIIARDRKINI
ncbi:MAG: D-TA family PLP-dependent enzyme [Bacteroidota bacterium]|nr:D-TA family PLP-dependent enzyme [Bacteroidota bacterium]